MGHSMASDSGPPKTTPCRFNVVIVAQAGRLTYEAVLFAASFRRFNKDFPGRLFVAEPQPGPLWSNDPRIHDTAARTLLIEHFGATILPFESRHFGEAYPYGNKIEALSVLPGDAPFVFFDTDTLITGTLMDVPFDFDRPSASLKVAPTWPRIALYGPGYSAIWQALYRKFGLDFASSLDPAWPDGHWRRYLYFNAGFFYFRDAARFGQRFAQYACAIRDTPPPELLCQSLDPWLDQVALPLVIHAFGGGRDALAPGWLDGTHSCHYRTLPLAYAREDQAVIDLLEDIATHPRLKAVLTAHAPINRMIYQRKGAEARALFDRASLPPAEAAIRKALKRADLWMR